MYDAIPMLRFDIIIFGTDAIYYTDLVQNLAIFDNFRNEGIDLISVRIRFVWQFDCITVCNLRKAIDLLNACMCL